MKKASVSILGCGWLGLPLAKRLILEGHHVKGSTTSEGGLAALDEADIEPYQIICSPHVSGKKIEAFFKADILFLNIPFKRSLTDPTVYQRQIESVMACVKNSPINFVVFASSTSIYPLEMAIASEDNSFVPHNARSQVLANTEQALLKNRCFDATIIRFAGLYGGTRQLGKFMQPNRPIPRNGENPVNLIHLDDCIEIVTGIIHQNIRNQILNACTDAHPTRAELYRAKAMEMGLTPPVFEGREPISKRIVSNQKIKDILNYQFIHPDPLR